MNTDSNWETNLPFFLGSPVSQVYRALGKPDRSRKLPTKLKETFVSSGIFVGSSENQVIEISVSWFEIGEKTGSFNGKILGIALGDSVERHRQRLGPPHHEKAYTSPTLIWFFDEFVLELTVWKEAGNEEPWGVYSPGDIRDIQVTANDSIEEDMRDEAARVVQKNCPSLSIQQIKETLDEMDS